jgi:hypothetical protein
MDKVVDPTIIIKTIGHQWYWSVPLMRMIEVQQNAPN